MKQPTESNPRAQQGWRIGFVLLSAAITCLFIIAIVILGISRLTYIRGVWGLAIGILQFFSLFFILIVTGLVGIWYTMIVIFNTTHPKYPPDYSRWVVIGFLMFFLILGCCWAELFYLVGITIPSATIPDSFVVMEWLFVMVFFGVAGFFFAAMSAITWCKWLSLSVKE
ncbi:MAG: hypothetical protein Q6364_14085 [Candidatus Hermodarchaeota archaeon]|nr:hypothetical protein [Candidatus Hermodarchaeota archaeon]